MTRQHGFTLVELFLTIALVAIVAGFAVPAIHDTILNSRLQNATGKVFDLFTEAKSLAVKENQGVYLSSGTEPGGSVCIGYNVGAPCACETAGSCQKVISDSEFPNIQYEHTAGFLTTPAFTPEGWVVNYWVVKIYAWRDAAATDLYKQNRVRVYKTGLILWND